MNMDLPKKPRRESGKKETRGAEPNKPVGKVGELIQRDERKLKAKTLKAINTNLKGLHNRYPDTFIKENMDFILSQAEKLINDNSHPAIKERWIWEMSTVLECMSTSQLPREEKQKLIEMFKKLL